MTTTRKQATVDLRPPKEIWIARMKELFDIRERAYERQKSLARPLEESNSLVSRLESSLEECFIDCVALGTEHPRFADQVTMLRMKQVTLNTAKQENVRLRRDHELETGAIATLKKLILETPHPSEASVDRAHDAERKTEDSAGDPSHPAG